MAESSPPVASPCVRLCTYDPRAGYCLGCYRTLDEITDWAHASEARRRTILAETERRRAIAERTP